MSQTNKTQRKNFGQTIKGVVRKKASDTIILKYLTNSRDYKMGEEQTIASDHIIIGRDPSCEVRFSDKFTTVSRIHASIEKKDGDWVLNNLSKSNPTLINNKPVEKTWFLSGEDTIQFSYEGPKIQFKVPSPQQKTSIPWSVVVKEQIIRPYKGYIISSAVFLLLLISGLIYALVYQEQAYEKQIESLRKLVELELEDKKDRQIFTDSVVAYNQERHENDLKQQQKKQRSISDQISPYFSDVWYIYCEGVEITFDGETKFFEEMGWTGTGFLLDNGKLITAGHVIKPWLYNVNSDEEAFLNVVYNKAGKVVARFSAYSPNGKKLTFTSDEVSLPRPTERIDYEIEGNTYELLESTWGDDWAWLNTSLKGKLNASYSTSTKLEISSKMHILGYPYSLGVQENGMTPLYSTSDVSTQGLSNGMIQLTNASIEPGNSGGPALFIENGKLRVVGIVSSTAGSSLGFLVPISTVR